MAANIIAGGGLLSRTKRRRHGIVMLCVVDEIREGSMVSSTEAGRSDQGGVARGRRVGGFKGRETAFILCSSNLPKNKKMVSSVGETHFVGNLFWVIRSEPGAKNGKQMGLRRVTEQIKEYNYRCGNVKYEE